MKPQVMRSIAIALVLISLCVSFLRLQGLIHWDLGVGRWPVLIIAIALLLAARRKEVRSI